MGELKFFQTHMGQRFFESSFPRMIKSLEKIGKELKRANDEKEEKENDKSTD